MEGVRRVWPWVLRVVWVVLALAVGPLVRELLACRSRPVQLVGTALAWVLWCVGLAAVTVLLPIGLVALRVLAPTVAATAVWAALRSDASPVATVVGVAASVVVLVCAFHPETGAACVNGPAYPNERRYLLRPPAVIQLLAMPVSGALVAAGAVGAPLLLAARAWVWGAACALVAAAVIAVLGRALRAQARRFVVFVPAGFVLHDELALREPVLFLRQKIEGIRAAPAGTDSLDLTRGASGLAVEVLLTEKAEVVVVDAGDREGRPGRTARFLCTPTQPGAVIADARARGLA